MLMGITPYQPERGSMIRVFPSMRSLFVLCTSLGLACLGTDRSPEQTMPAVEDWEWQHYLGDERRSHYSPLAQIHRTNVDQLEVAWTYDTGPLEASLSQIQCNPIVVNGVLYGTSSRSHVFALDAETGRELWLFDPVRHGSAAQGHNRGVVHWAGPGGGRMILGPCHLLCPIF